MEMAPPLLAGGQPGVDRAYAAAHFGKSLFWQAGELLLASAPVADGALSGVGTAWLRS